MDSLFNHLKSNQSLSREICRTCLKVSFENEQFLKLTSEDMTYRSISYLRKLQDCVPEMVVETGGHSALCPSCTIALNSAYSFKRMCLQTEERLKTFNGTNCSNVNYEVAKKDQEINVDKCALNNASTATADIKHESTKSTNDPSTTANEAVNIKCEFPVSTDNMLTEELQIKSEFNAISLSAENLSSDNTFVDLYLNEIEQNLDSDLSLIMPDLPDGLDDEMAGNSFTNTNKENKSQPLDGSIPKSLTDYEILKKACETIAELQNCTPENLQCNVSLKKIPKSKVIKRRHCKFVSKKHKCDHCGQRFTSNYKKVIHENRIHLHSCPYTCHICLKGFYENYLLTKHIRIVHNEENQLGNETGLRSFNFTESPKPTSTVCRKSTTSGVCRKSTTSTPRKPRTPLSLKLRTSTASLKSKTSTASLKPPTSAAYLKPTASIVSLKPATVSSKSTTSAASPKHTAHIAYLKPAASTIFSKPAASPVSSKLTTNTESLKSTSTLSSKPTTSTMFVKPTASTVTPPSDENSTKNTINKFFYCQICNIIFESIESLYIHIETHRTTDSLFQCELCPKKIKTLHNFNVHQLSHGSKYFCKICNKMCPKDHEFKHTGERTFSCLQCNATFLTNQDAITHMKKVHHDFNPYKCTICLEGFVKREHLLDHMKVHANYKCDGCNKEFANKLVYDCHICMNLHSNQVYECQVCNVSFLGRPYLIEHMRTHVQDSVDIF